MEKPSYKDSIRLPKTNYSMKANSIELAKRISEHWNNLDIYSKIREKSKGNPKFILHDGPPYANGNIHLGTALNKILKDILVKGNQVIGKDAPFVAGWDCHGLPIEWKVEEKYKKKGIKKEEIEVVKFRQECREFAKHWLDIQKEEFKSLGVIADYKKPYITMEFESEALIYKEITKVLMNGGLYLGKKPIMWSTVEKTALAEAEVEYHDKISDEIYVGFKINQTSVEFNQYENAYMVVWTTTPWTIPANKALAFNPHIAYALYEVVKVDDESLVNQGINLVVAKSVASSVMAKLKVLEYNEIAEIPPVAESQSGDDKLNINHPFNSFKMQHPLHGLGEIYNFLRNIYPAPFVEEGVGTGIVHMAPAYGLDDFHLVNNINKKITNNEEKISLKDSINDNGTYKEEIPLFASQHIFKAQGAVGVENSIINEIYNNNTLFGHFKLKHSYPHSWRSKAPLIYRLTSQWFLNLENNNVREKALNAINNDIKFFPSTGKNRLESMVKNRPDWCLSRQRLWGVPIAIFVNTKTEEVLKDDEVNKKIIKAFKKEGADAWFKQDPLDFLNGTKFEESKHEYRAVYDVIDVWFDSGSTHAFVLNQRKELQAPADVYLEGSDQHRGWFQSSLLENIAAEHKSLPYKALLTHGFVLDKSGKDKMSKSLGNVVTPQQIIDKHGVEILRLWVANSDYQEDIKFSDEILKQQIDIYRKIRNTLRYMLGNLTHYSDDIKVEYKDLPNLEQYILHKIQSLNKKFAECFEKNYEFHRIFNEIYNFITLDLSAFYFDIRKDSLYCDSSQSLTFKSTLTVINILFDYLVKWLSPFISFTAEEAYLERYKETNETNSIMLSSLNSIPDVWSNDNVYQAWEKIKNVRKEVLSIIETERANKVIGSSLEAEVTIYAKSDYLKLLNSIDFASVCIVSSIILKPLDEFKGEENQSDFYIVFNKKEGHKCVRCWKIFDKVYNDICERCNSVVTE